MILKNGQDIVLGGKRFVVGNMVKANDTTMYDGLEGEIIGVRTDLDMETENVDPDIYVDFGGDGGEVIMADCMLEVL